MRNLLNFLIKNNYWFLFILLEVASFVLIVKYNNYQRSTFLTSANSVIGNIYEVTDDVTSYFNLKTANKALLKRNSDLENKVLNMQSALSNYLDSLEIQRLAKTSLADYNFQDALVINNSLNLNDNFITLDKGEIDGIAPEMGVVGINGIVGIVFKTSPHYSIVLSLLNSKSNISCKVKGNEYFGYLRWNGEDSQFAYLHDLPRYSEFHLGDTIVTSGYSAIFPFGMMVGVVDDMKYSDDGLSYLLKVKLATNFGNLNNVFVISKKEREEQKELEKMK